LPTRFPPTAAAPIAEPQDLRAHGIGGQDSLGFFDILSLTFPPRPRTGSAGAAKRSISRVSPGSLLHLYRSDVGKKYVMAATGLVLMAFVLVHMAGNLKLYLGSGSLNHYAHFLRTAGEPVLPYEVALWVLRIVLIVAVVAHFDSAYRLAMKARRARPVGYAAPRRYREASFASRTMRWTGPIVLLFVIFHLLDLTWGTTNPNFHSGLVYENVVASFQRTPVAIAYVIANLALAYHLYHGAWSMFQSIGRAGPSTRRGATGFAALIALGNISFPLAVMVGVVK
jgi:succinate dehydrogenase / fumarate reductase cytochrome b subunit